MPPRITWLTVTALTLLVACAVACTTRTTVPTDVPEAMVTAPPTRVPSPPPTATAALKPGEQVELQRVAWDAAGAKKLGGRVTVLANWEGSDQASFLDLVLPFEEATGTEIEYSPSRDLDTDLTTRVQVGNPPDLAVLTGPWQLAHYAQQGKLVDLGAILDSETLRAQYGPEWIDLTSVNGKLYGVFVRAALQGLIWYDTKSYQPAGGPLPPKSWEELQAWTEKVAASGTTPWCLGLGSGAESGMPGSAWIQDWLLRQAGPAKYEAWWQGKLAWTSPEVKQAWQSLGQIATDPKMVYGGPTTELTTDWSVAGDPLFKNPPGCYLDHQSSWITEAFGKDNPDLHPFEDWNFYPFPDINPDYAGTQQVSGDLLGLFNDTPQARALLKYLVTPAAQAHWVERTGGLSLNRRVHWEDYPDPLSRQAAQLLFHAKITEFDASERMPEQMRTAFWKGILDYVQNPDNLDTILSNLDALRKDAYKP